MQSSSHQPTSQRRIMSTGESAIQFNGSRLMNAQWTGEHSQSSLPPFLHGVAFNDNIVKFSAASPSIAPCSSINILSSPFYHHNSNRNAQIRLQTQQKKTHNIGKRWQEDRKNITIKIKKII
jgi:hypothetical protein